jgi:hypothetical protein
MPMPGHFEQVPRDGTKQSERFLPALDSDYVKVDERSIRELLAFSQGYGRQLKYYDAQNQEAGDWSGFLGDLDLDDVVAYLEGPEEFSAEQARKFSRPHFALFLVFLKLFDRTRKELNLFTRRHLDFYYRQVLRMTHRPSVPDRVHVLVDLASDTEQLLLPSGTALSAGTDSSEQNLVYLTDREIVVNHAQVDQIRSLYVDKKRTGIRETREDHHGPQTEAFLRMLEVALGEPDPGDSLPLYPFEPGRGKKVDYDLLVKLHDLVDFVGNEKDGLAMPMHEFRDLMLRKRRREGEGKEWEEVNSILQEAGQSLDRNFRLNPQDPKDFQTNLRKALGGPPNLDHFYDGLPEVKSIEEAYEHRNRVDVRRFIQDKLHLRPERFDRMMEIKLRVENEWQEINRLLERAGERKRKDPGYQLLVPDQRAARDFDKNLQTVLSSPQFSRFEGIDGIAKFHQAFLAVEEFFFMPAEIFSFIMTVVRKEVSSKWQWETVYQNAADAHAEKIYTRRRNALAEAHKTSGLDGMFRLALGEKISSTAGSSLLEKLEPFVPKETDYAYLKEVVAANASLTDWDRVYRILEIAQRNREDFKKPVPWKEDWLSLWPQEDATAVRVQSRLPDDHAMARWKTFGQGQLSAVEAPPSAGFGWALSSPLLVLTQGTRTIELTLAFSPEKFDLKKIRSLLAPANQSTKATFSPFQIQVSTATGWLEPAATEIRWKDNEMGNYPELSANQGSDLVPLKALRFSLTLDKAQAPLTLPKQELHGLNASWPVVRLMLKPVWEENYRQTGRGRYVTHYQTFRDLVLLRIHLGVKVDDFGSFRIQNDEGILDAKRPFEPFGLNPSTGSRFYLGHSELASKKLDELSFKIEWLAPPKDLSIHYRNYLDTDIKDNASFKAQISEVDHRQLIPFSDPQPLFEMPDAQKLRELRLVRKIQPAPPGSPPATNILLSDDLRDWSCYLQWELQSPDFQHQAYPTVAIKRSVEMAAALVREPSKVTAEAFQVNPPYTPRIKRLTLGYTSTEKIILEPEGKTSGGGKAFHLHPFGYRAVEPEVGPPGCRFLPEYNFEGELFLGLTKVRPPQNLALLFQMAEGSADPDLTPEPVQWSYLSANRWFPLHRGNILLDATRGLINSGIIEFALPPAEPSTLLSPSLYWIRAAVLTNSHTVCDTIAIHAQAVAATFENRNNAPDHLSTPLSANRITDLVNRQPMILGLRQPYTSFGGDNEESDQQFYVRVSERLRHKQRAVTQWDYERLVLEHFPQIYKVKCLTADLSARPEDHGQVEVVVVPDIRNRLPFDPFEPKAATDLIADIESYLKDKTSSFARVKVRNARYLPVKVRLGVRFHSGKDEGFYQKQLNEELNRFLSPWAYQEGADLVFGEKIFANSIINFVDQRPYVDFVAELKLFISEDGKTFRPVPVSGSEGYYVAAGRPDGVLVAARQHEFDLISEGGYEAKEFTGINYLKIELDFVVG